MNILWVCGSMEECELLKKSRTNFSFIRIKDIYKENISQYEKLIVLLTEKQKDLTLFHLGRISKYLDKMIVLNLLRKDTVLFLKDHYPVFYYEEEQSLNDFCFLLNLSKKTLKSFLMPILEPHIKRKILFLTGVPGVGKTTIAYHLLKYHPHFKIVEETDIIRDILVGYDHYIQDTYNAEFSSNILNHTFILNMDMMLDQCNKMKYSILEVVNRQIRKNIPTIINGVHLIPTILDTILQTDEVIYIQFYIHDKEYLEKRIKNRDPNSHMLPKIDEIFHTNQELRNMFLNLTKKDEKRYLSLDITNRTVEEVISEVLKILEEN